MVLAILIRDIRRNYLPHFALAALIALLIPMFVSISALKDKAAAQPVEMFLTLTGIAALTPVFLPERDESVRDVIRARRTDCTVVYGLRAVCALLFLGLLFGGFGLAMKLCESEATVKLLAGGFASAALLGAVGFAVSGLSGNTAAGYMAAFIYYMANFALKKKLGVFFLFSVCFDGDFSAKPWQLLIAAAIISAVLAVKKRLP